MSTPTTTERINDLIASLATLSMDRTDNSFAFAPARAEAYADNASHYLDAAVRCANRGRNRPAHFWLSRCIGAMYPEGADVPHTFRIQLAIILDALDTAV